MRSNLLPAMALVGLVAAESSAQPNSQAVPVEPRWFLEPTYVSFVVADDRPGEAGTPAERKPHFAEIASNNHLTLWPRQNSDRYRRFTNPERGETSAPRGVYTLTLGTVIRGHSDASVPIQTPSIGFAGRYHHLVHSRSASSDSKGRPLPDESTIKMWMVGLVHHSNGQEGCPFQGQTRNSNGDCLPEDKEVYKDPLNTIDGSFGTNYWVVGWGRSKKRVGEGTVFGRGWTISLEGRYHQNFPGGGLKAGMRERYGAIEAAGMFQREWHHRRLGILKWWPYGAERFRHPQLTVRGAVRRAKRETYWSSSAQLAWLGFGGGTIGPMLMGFVGDDYYNIRFDERRRFIMVGLLWDHAGFARKTAVN